MALTPGDLPSEFLVRPTAFVALTGLDIVHNAIHKAVWDAFVTNRRPEKVPIVFKVLDGDHEYPKSKTKRSSYDFYVPKGILKTNWVKKHLYDVPSLVVIFYDLDWDDPMWNEKKMECESKLEVVRSTLNGRDTKVALVLMQKNSILPGDDGAAKAAAMSLCSSCELTTNCLFVLPHTDHLPGYILRLENAFYDLAQSYYHVKIRSVKSHLEELKTITHQLLFVRHQFKIAFFSELRQDIASALKHYKQAYSNLLEIRSGDTHVMEVKTIAGFLNYKICRLSFQMNIPLDAISQFRRHIDLHKTKIGPKELSFEHSAWMSKQFSIFGDLFHEAITSGLSAIQIQHPGFYYQQAAYHCITRKLQCQELTQELKDAVYPQIDPLASIDSLEYFGQRPWRPAIQSIDPPDFEKEKQGMMALQLKDLSVNHSMLIITLLSSAVAQFKKYKCPRMKRFLLVQMGEEYYHTKDYERALTLLSRVMWDYRWEKWWNLLKGIQIMALRSAYLVANVQEYLTLMLEVLSKWIPFSRDEKQRIQMNLFKVISNEIPEPEPGCPLENLNEAFRLWNERKRNHIPIVFTVEMHNIIPFVDCQAWFSDASYQADKCITVEVCIRVSCPLPIRFSKLSVLFSNQHYNQYCVLIDKKGHQPNFDVDYDNHDDLVVEPGQPKFHSFSIIAHPQDLNKKIEIVGIVLQLGSDSNQCAVGLHWITNGSENIYQKTTWSPWRELRSFQTPGEVNYPNRPVCRITPRDSCVRINVQHEPPALVNEFYLFRFVFTNNEICPATNVKVTVGLKEEQESVLELSTHFCMDKPVYNDTVVSRLENVKLDNLEPGAEIFKIVYMKPLQIGVRPIFIKIEYDVEVNVGDHFVQCACSKEEEFMVPTVKGFEVSSKLMSLKFENLDAVRAKEPFLLLQDITCISPWPLTILDSKLELNQEIQSMDKKVISQLQNIDLQNGDRASECVCLVARKETQNLISLGKYTLKWKRKMADESIPPVETCIAAPSTSIQPATIFIDVDLPANGWMRTPLTATYTILNYTSKVQDFELTMEASDAFMFAGQKQLHFRVMPNGQHELKYNLYPLLAGYVALPRLHLTLPGNATFQSTLDNLVEKLIPGHIFILPQGKSLPDLNELNVKQL